MDTASRCFFVIIKYLKHIFSVHITIADYDITNLRRYTSVFVDDAVCLPVCAMRTKGCTI